MRFLAALLLSAVLAPAQTHPHATSATYLVNAHSLDWKTQEYDAEEKLVSTKPTGWYIMFDTRTMYDQETGRRFEEKEAVTIRGEFEKVVAFAAGLVASKPEEVVSIHWDLEQKRVSITFQRDTLLTSWIDIEGRVHNSEGISVLLDDSTQTQLWGTSHNVIKYCLESTLWWRAGHGETTEPKKAEVSRAPILVVVGR